MKRKYKLLIIILSSVFIAYFIYIFNLDNKIYLSSFGDGVSSGQTSYNIDGISYNDYLKEYYQSKNMLKEYNKEYTKTNYKIKEFLNDIKENHYDKFNDIYIEQIIHKSNIITLCFGEDELTKLSMTNDINEEIIKEFLKNYDKVLKELNALTEAKIFVIGLYENTYLSKSNLIIINSELANIVNKYQNVFINISDLMLNKEYFLNKNSYYFSYLGHETISEIILHSI